MFMNYDHEFAVLFFTFQIYDDLVIAKYFVFEMKVSLPLFGY